MGFVKKYAPYLLMAGVLFFAYYPVLTGYYLHTDDYYFMKWGNFSQQIVRFTTITGRPLAGIFVFVVCLYRQFGMDEFIAFFICVQSLCGRLSFVSLALCSQMSSMVFRILKRCRFYVTAVSSLRIVCVRGIP